MSCGMSKTTANANSSSDEDVVELRRGPWTLEEDKLLVHFISSHGEGRWNLLATRSGLRRTGKSCRLRWLNYLKPDVKRGNLTPEEQLLILQLHSKWGNRWSKIAQHLPGRTDNEIKNYWRTRVQKQARHLNIDSNSTAFQEVIRCLWMPRLVQKIHGSSSSSLSSSSYSSSDASHFKSINHLDQNSATDVQVSDQGPLDPMIPTMYSLDHDQMKTSTSESMAMSSATPFHDMANFECNNNTLQKMSSYNNCQNFGYDLENFSIESKSVFGDSENPICQSNWGDYDLDNTLWNIDDLWQFRQLQ